MSDGEASDTGLRGKDVYRAARFLGGPVSSSSAYRARGESLPGHEGRIAGLGGSDTGLGGK